MYKVAIQMTRMSQGTSVAAQRMKRQVWKRCWASQEGYIHKPSPAQPSPASPSPAPEPTSSVLDDETTMRVPRKDLKWAARLLQDLPAGKKVRIPARASRDEVPFEVPDVGLGIPTVPSAINPSKPPGP